jgi:hypothetical protein
LCREALGGVGVSLSCILSLILVLVVQVFQNYKVQENINIIKIINSMNGKTSIETFHP